MVSDGCRHCYAMRLAATRLRGHPSRVGLTDGRGNWTGEVRFNADWLDQPLRWSRPRRIFVCGHGDLFHEAVPADWIDQVFGGMALCPQHTFQVLTKRPRRMREYFEGLRQDDSVLAGIGRLHCACATRFGTDRQWEEAMARDWPLPNVWLGTSVEDQETSNERIPVLLETPAAVRWISAEPLLGPLTVFDLDGPVDAREGMDPGLHWVVAGGESGPGARPMDPEWARSLRDQCGIAGVPFFLKQWGGATAKAGGRILDGRTWDELPARGGAGWNGRGTQAAAVFAETGAVGGS